jgi:hypothetical protein
MQGMQLFFGEKLFSVGKTVGRKKPISRLN